MTNPTQPTPEQLAKWREEFAKAFPARLLSASHGVVNNNDYVLVGYIRAKQETEQALKDARNQALEDALDLFPQGFAMLSTNQVREIIRGLLK